MDWTQQALVSKSLFMASNPVEQSSCESDSVPIKKANFQTDLTLFIYL